MDLSTWLQILLFGLIAGVGSYVVRRVLRWRGLTKDQIQWAVVSILALVVVLYTALHLLGIG